MLRPVTVASLIATAALAICAPVASAQAPTPTTTAPAAAAPPKVDSLRLPRTIAAQQGHARFLVGLRLATRSKVTVQVIAASGGRVVQTRTDATARPAGRAYLRIEAVDSAGFQMLAGNYRVRVQAADDQGRVSPAVEAPFRLRLTEPHGLFDAYTVPVWPAFRRQAGTTAAGQLVAVVGPKGSVVAAGLRRGDVITSVGGKSVATRGAWDTAMRGLLSETPVAIEYVRKGATVSTTLDAAPDWEAAPDLAKSLAVAVKREPRSPAYAVAQARQLVDTGKLTEARALMTAWPKAWRTSAPGELVAGELLGKQNRWKQALGAYNRARKRDPAMAAAEYGRGQALSALGKGGPSRAAFAAAARLDPTDAAAAGFHSYALLAGGDVPGALAAAQRAVSLDPRYADAFLPFGISLIKSGDKAAGVKALRRGLVLLEDADRADDLIAAHLSPTDP